MQVLFREERRVQALFRDAGIGDRSGYRAFTNTEYTKIGHPASQELESFAATPLF